MIFCDRLIVNEAVKHLGGIDILILNAAKTPSPIMFTEFEDPVSACDSQFYYMTGTLSISL